MEIREVEVPDPKPGELQVIAKANGICAADVAAFTASDKRGQPVIAGHEGVGQVLRVGSDVKDFQPGEFVTCARWQKLQNVDAGRACKIPGNPEDPALWIVEPVARVVNAAHHSMVRPGDRVVVLGTGFMGLMIVQLLARYPVYELIAVDVKAANLKLAAQFGATETINSATSDGQARVEAIKENLFDLVIETAGVQQTADLGAQLTRPGGRYCIFARHQAPRQIDLGAWHTKGIKVLNASPAMDIQTGYKGNLERAVRCLWRGLVDTKLLITHRHKFADAQEALEVAARRPDGYLKGVLTVEK